MQWSCRTRYHSREPDISTWQKTDIPALLLHCRGGDAPITDIECDTGLAIDSMEPLDGALAIGLCKTTTEESGEWGVISATWVQVTDQPGYTPECDNYTLFGPVPGMRSAPGWPLASPSTRRSPSASRSR